MRECAIGGSRPSKKIIGSSQFHYRARLIAAGQKGIVDRGGYEESLAISALKRQDEIEFVKTKVLVTGMIAAGNRIAAALAGSASDSESLTKAMEGLQALLLPHMSEAVQSKAERAQEILAAEAQRGELKYKVVGGNKDKPGRIRRGPKDADVR